MIDNQHLSPPSPEYSTVFIEKTIQHRNPSDYDFQEGFMEREIER